MTGNGNLETLLPQIGGEGQRLLLLAVHQGDLLDPQIRLPEHPGQFIAVAMGV